MSNQFETWIKTLPKGILVAMGLTAIVLGVLIMDPPRTLCDAQFESVKAELTPFLFDVSTGKNKRKAEFQDHFDRCKSTNSPGGCYELFFQMKSMLRSLDAVSPECASQAGGNPKIKTAIWDTISLIVKIAWGSKPPETYHTKFAWLDPSDLNLYCVLKKQAVSLYGKAGWESFQEKVLKDTSFPGVSTMNRNQVWDAVLLSTNCQQFL